MSESNKQAISPKAGKLGFLLPSEKKAKKDLEFYSGFSSYFDYRLYKNPNRSRNLDPATCKRLGIEFDGLGRLNPLGSNANNVDNSDKSSRVPAFSSSISSLELDDYKPVRSLNHAIKKEISQNRLAYKRVHDCGCKTIGKEAELFTDSRHGNCRVSNVETCGSVWACPVCADKILKQRSDDLKEIGKKWKQKGGNLYLLTLTFSHSKNDILSDLIGSSTEKTGLMGAIRQFRQSRVWKEFKNTFDYEADCRSLEITWGNASGFHPHIHMLVYTKTPIAPYLQKYWESKIYKNWALQCDKMGLGAPSRKHGTDLRGASVADYIAKWGSSSELSSGHVKQSKNGNLTIRQLQECLVDDLKRSIYGLSLQKVKALLSVYNNTMKGNKLLTWGGQKKGQPSFKVRMIGGSDTTDEELAKIQKEELQFLDKKLEIDSSSWMSIYWRGHSAKVRDIMEQFGVDGVLNWACDHGYNIYKWNWGVALEDEKMGLRVTHKKKRGRLETGYSKDVAEFEQKTVSPYMVKDQSSPDYIPF